jgi:hypothetical protein
VPVSNNEKSKRKIYHDSHGWQRIVVLKEE